MDGVVVQMSPDQQSASGVLTLLRDLPPSHYTIKIESFSALRNSGIESFESREFEASGHHWKLNVYPNGNKRKGVTNHVSLYLAISDVAKLPKGFEINAYFKFFVYDHIRDKFLMFEDANGETKRFHQMKTEWGLDNFLSLDILKDASNGYLSDDCCIFGVEVFVLKNSGFRERFITVRDPPNGTFTWKIENFLTKDAEVRSREFNIGGYKWKIICYPKGNEKVKAKGKAMSLYLELVHSETVPLKRNLHALYSFRLIDQCGGRHFERTSKVNRFTPTSSSLGFNEFLDLAKLQLTSGGCLVKDTLTVEVEMKLISSSTDY